MCKISSILGEEIGLPLPLPRMEEDLHIWSTLSTQLEATPMPTMDETMIKIILELLSTLALATNELKHARSREYGFADVLLC